MSFSDWVNLASLTTRILTLVKKTVAGNVLFSFLRPPASKKSSLLLDNDALKDLSGGSPCCGGAVVDEEHAINH